MSVAIIDTVAIPFAIVLSVGANITSTLPTMDSTTVCISFVLDTVKSVASRPSSVHASLASSACIEELDSAEQ